MTRRRLTLEALAATVVSHLVVLLAMAASATFLSDHARPGRGGTSLLIWDGAFYRDIAASGYEVVGHAGLRFFPFVPLVARGLAGPFGRGYGPAVVVVTWISAFAFVWWLARLVELETADVLLARRAIWLAALFPAAAVLTLGYAEATFLAFAVGAVYCARRRRWLLVALLAAAAGTTRPLGLFLMVPVAIEAICAWRTSTWRSRVESVVAVAGAAIGTGAYLLWSSRTYGDFLLPFRVQSAGNLRGGVSDPITRIGRGISDLFGGHVASGSHVLWALFAIGLLVVLWRRLPPAYGAYATVSLVVLLTGDNLDSFERYLFSTFPFVIAIVLLVPRRPAAWWWATLSVSGVGLFAYSTLAFLGRLAP